MMAHTMHQSVTKLFPLHLLATRPIIATDAVREPGAMLVEMTGLGSARLRQYNSWH